MAARTIAEEDERAQAGFDEMKSGVSGAKCHVSGDEKCLEFT